MSTLLQAATEYRDAGLSVIGSRSKNLFPGWKEFQEARPSDSHLHYFFIERKFPFLAIICGAGSGNLEVIDVDTKNDPTGTLWQRLWERIVDLYKGEPPFAIVQTPSGGIHIYYRCEVIEGNKKLAKLAGAKEAIIETRGQGGLVLAPPTAGYTFLDNRIPHAIPTISPDEREDMLAICLEFNEVFEEPREVKAKSASTYKHTPWDEYNQVDDWKDVLLNAGWKFSHKNETWEYWIRPGKEEGHSASFNLSSRQFYVFSSSTDFVIQKGYRPFDILKIVKHASDVRKAIHDAKEAGYGLMYSGAEEEFIGKAVMQFNSGNLIDDIRDMLAFDFEAAFRGHKDVSLDKLLEAAKLRSIEGSDVFWIEDDNGKLHLEKSALADYLQYRGFRLLVDNEYAKQYRLVRVDPEHNIIQYIAHDQLRKDIDNSLYEGQHNTSIRKLRNLVHGITDATIKTAIDHLPRLCIDQTKFLIKGGDDKTQWFSFRNGAVKVTGQGIEIIPYSELPAGMLVWKKDIKPFDFEVSDIETEDEFNKSVVWLFFKRICGITKDIEHLDHQNELPEQYPELSAKFNSLITTVGFLLSTYKNTDESFMPILEEDIEQASKGGGTGKGLVIKIIGFLRSVVDLNCKVWTPSTPFPHQKITVETDIIHYNDYEPSKFKISELNNDVTEGIDIQNKYEGEFKVPFEISPKGVVTTNYRTPDEAEFEARRQKKIYLVKYFTRQHRPKHEFGKEFGRGSTWTDFDWHITHNILIYCLQNYLVAGVSESIPTENVKRKAIIEGYGQEFLDFMEMYLVENKGRWEIKKDIYHAFLNDSEVDKKYFTARRFEKACSAYATKMGLEFVSERNNSRLVGERDQFYYIFGDMGKLPPFEAKFIKGFNF